MLTADDADSTYLETNHEAVDRPSRVDDVVQMENEMLRWLLPKMVTACVEYNHSL